MLNNESTDGTSLNVDFIRKNIKRALEMCLERNLAQTSLANKKSDLALKIIDNLQTNSVYLNNYKQLIEEISPILNDVSFRLFGVGGLFKIRMKYNFLFKTFFKKEYFDKLLKLFQKTCPFHALRTVKSLIGILRNVIFWEI